MKHHIHNATNCKLDSAGAVPEAEPPLPRSCSLPLQISGVGTDERTGVFITGGKPPLAGLSEAIQELTPQQKNTLAQCEQIITTAKGGSAANFVALTKAMYKIQRERLYRGTHTSLAAYFKARFHYGRAHAHRLAAAGEIFERVSPRGDTIAFLVSEAHTRPLIKLTHEQQDQVLQLIQTWIKMAGQTEITPKMVQAAVAFLRPPDGPKDPNDAKMKLVKKFVEVVRATKAKLPPTATEDIVRLFTHIEKKAVALGDPPKSTGIDWTGATWNPLQGCARKSAGCDNCYAAKLAATRLKDVYPGLATKAVKQGKTSFIFNNNILLSPEQFGQPLLDRTPKRYFVNSMSDLFHDKVPDDFIHTVFEIMEKARWHQFQVLTKRPERMAKFTQQYYGDREPAPNIWLGTSTENQKAYDERRAHLLATKAAIRWLSCEPLIGPIALGDTTGFNWIVVGGESGSDRRMEKEWALSLRDQCEMGKVPFFFKQWGDFNELGIKTKKPKKDRLTPPTLDGVVYNEYPA